MSDVIFAAMIAGGVSVVGNVTTIVVAKWQTKTAIEAVEHQATATMKTAERHAAVELAKIEGELDRLRREHREAERSRRQGTYQRLLVVLDRFDMYASGFPPTDQREVMVSLEEFNNLFGAVSLLAPPSVHDAASPLVTAVAELGERISADAKPAEPYAKSYARAYAVVREDIIRGTATLIHAMRDDVTAEILPTS